jgi:hypothetical protein
MGSLGRIGLLGAFRVNWSTGGGSEKSKHAKGERGEVFMHPGK